MQNYIKQLIDDIHRATLRLRPPHDIWIQSKVDPNNEAELEDFTFLEKYYEGEEEPISQITGIEAELLPPPEKLSEEQQATLAIELEKLLIHFNFQLQFPENYPPNFKYPFIKDFWEESHVALSFGLNEIEFCDMNDEVFCPFEGYCKICEEEREQNKLEEELEAKYRAEHPDENYNDWPGDFNIEDLLPKKEEIEAFIKNQKELDGIDFDNAPYSLFYLKDELRFKMTDKQGTEIKIEDLPVPNLCTICKIRQSVPSDEGTLCLVERYEQKDSNNFKCSMFKKI